MIKTRLFRLLAHARKYIAATVGLQWAALLAQIIAMFAVADLLADAYAGTLTAGLLQRTGLLLMATVLVRVLCTRLSTRSAAMASADVKRTLREKIYAKLLALGVTYRQRVHTAEVLQLTTEGVEQLETYFGRYLPQLFYSLLAPLTLFVTLARVSLAASAVLLLCVPLIPLSIVAVQRIARSLLGKYWGMYADMGDSFLENLHGLTTLKIFGADEARAEKMDEEAESFRKMTMKVLIMQLNSISVMDLVAYGGAAVGMIVALSQFIHGSLELAGALKVILLAAEFFLPLRLLGSYFHIAMNGMAASDRIFALLDTEEPKKGGLPLHEWVPDVRLDDVSYSHDGYRRHLQNIDLHLDGNGLYALVGASGSGKSTLAALLAGRHPGWEGLVRISGFGLETVREEDVMRHILLVRGDSRLFQGTVEENLLAANPYVSRQEMENILQLVGLAEYLATREGLETRLTENGNNLSGGQRQRLILARSILFDPDMLILDEVTSGIDRESEEHILSVLERLSAGRIVVLITHRLQNVTRCRRIFRMEEGRITGAGTHAELLASDAGYARLYEKQQVLERYAGAVDRGIPETTIRARAAACGQAVGADELGKGTAGAVSGTGAPAETGAAYSNTGAAQSPHAKSLAAQANVSGAAFDAGSPDEGAGGAPADRRRQRSALAVMTRLIRLLLPLTGVMAVAVVLGVLGHLSAIFIALKAGQGIVTGTAELEPVLGSVFAVMLLLAVARGLLHYAEQYCNHFIAFRLLAMIRHHVFAALRRLCPARLEGRDKGSLIALLTSDIELLEVFYAHTISPALIALLTSLIMVIYIGRYSVPAAILAAAAYLLVGIAVPVWNGRRTSGEGASYRDAFRDMNSYLLESLYGLDETVQFGYGAKRQAAIVEQSDALTARKRKLSEREGGQRAVTDLLILLASYGMLFLTLQLFQSESLEWSGVLLCTLAMMGSFGPTAALSNLSSNLNQTLASGERVLDLLEEEPVTEDIPLPDTAVEETVSDGLAAQEDTTTPATAPSVAAALDNVAFAYEGRPLFDGLTAAFPARSITGLYGASGCGKSTVLKLLMRFWEVNGGAVLIEGRDINTIPTEHLRKKQACVTQDTWLFHDTIAENIAIGRPGASRAQIEEAARKAAIHDFISTLPNGYDTPVGELGDTLSSGERQRIGLARAFLRDADILLLDEPTSNLDALNEGMILQSLKECTEGKSVILVSHRRSTLNVAEQIRRLV